MKKLSIKEMVIFSMLGAIMYISKELMAFLPNIHILGLLIMVYTLTYRGKALIPIYVFVLLEGLFAGFAVWWIPYLYIWTVLWGVTMLLPQKMPNKIAVPVYMIVCSLHGLSYGTLYSPVWALWMGFNLETTISWIVTGFPWDIIQALGNLAFGTLIVPLTKLLKKLNAQTL